MTKIAIKTEAFSNIINCGKNIESKTGGRVWLAADLNSPLIPKPGFFRRLFCNFSKYSKPKVAGQLQKFVETHKAELAQNAEFVKYANLVYQKLSGSDETVIKLHKPAKGHKKHGTHKTTHAAPKMLAVRVTTPEAVAAEKAANAQKIRALQIGGRELRVVKTAIETVFPGVTLADIQDGKIHLPDDCVFLVNQHLNKQDKADYRSQGLSLVAATQVAALRV